MTTPPRQSPQELQEDLVRRYCEKAEATLRSAPEYRSALRGKQDPCERFARECKSALVIRATRSYLDTILHQQWDEARDDRSHPIDHH